MSSPGMTGAIVTIVFLDVLAGAILGEWKNRGRYTGAMLGLLLGPLGVLILALMPRANTSSPRSGL